MSNSLQQDPVGTLLAAVSQQVGFTLTKTNTVVNAPTRVEFRNRNSRFEIRCLPSSGRLGKIVVYYNRIHVSALGLVRVERNQSDYVSDLLGAVNAQKGVYISNVDIIDEALPPRIYNLGKIELDLSFAAGSWFWYSGVPSVSVALPVAPIVYPANGTAIDAGCHGYAYTQSLADGSGGFTEVVLDAHSVLCGWDPGTNLKGTGWLRFIEPVISARSGAMMFKA